MLLYDRTSTPHANKVDCLLSPQEVDALIRHGKLFSFEGLNILYKTIRQAKAYRDDTILYLPISNTHLAQTAVCMRDSQINEHTAPRHSPGIIEFGDAQNDAITCRQMASEINNYLCTQYLEQYDNEPAI